MLSSAAAFNQDLGAWSLDSLEDMGYMFWAALAFDQDLGWCVAEDVDIGNAFENGKTPCASTSCGVVQMDENGECLMPSPRPTVPPTLRPTPNPTPGPTPRPTFRPTPVPTPRPVPQPTPRPVPQPTPRPSPSPTPQPTSKNVMTDSNIYTARDAWFSNSATAEATYGHISTWDTSLVTRMADLFCADPAWPNSCNPARASFNDDISAWDTSSVTTMHGIFRYCSSFDQDIGGWAVHSVTSMDGMFYYASAFNQDLGWCVDDDVKVIWTTFSYSGCASTSCGVVQVNSCHVVNAATPARGPRRLVALVLALFLSM